MKCLKYKCILSQDKCILRQEIIKLLKFEGKPLKTFSKCEDCNQGRYIKDHFPIEGKDNDVFNLMVCYIKLKKPKIIKEEKKPQKELNKIFKKKLIKFKLQTEKEEKVKLWKRRNF